MNEGENGTLFAEIMREDLPQVVYQASLNCEIQYQHQIDA